MKYKHYVGLIRKRDPRFLREIRLVGNETETVLSVFWNTATKERDHSFCAKYSNERTRPVLTEKAAVDQDGRGRSESEFSKSFLSAGNDCAVKALA